MVGGVLIALIGGAGLLVRLDALLLSCCCPLVFAVISAVSQVFIYAKQGLLDHILHTMVQPCYETHKVRLDECQSWA